MQLPLWFWLCTIWFNLDVQPLIDLTLKICLSFSWPHTGSGAKTDYGGRGLWRDSELQVVWQPTPDPHLDQEGLQHGEESTLNLPLNFDSKAHILQPCHILLRCQILRFKRVEKDQNHLWHESHHFNYGQILQKSYLHLCLRLKPHKCLLSGKADD